MICAAGIYAADRVSKMSIVSSLSVGESIPVIPGFFHLTFIYNTGASFGMLQDKGVFFIIINSLILIGICWAVFFRKEMTTAGRILLGVVAGGALGNMTDRLCYGAVVDFLDFRGIWPYIFNIADMAVICGGFLFALLIILTDRKPGKEKAKPKH